MNGEENLIIEIANRIKENGGEIYFVGGYVRDKNLGLKNKDIDVEIYGLGATEVSNILREFGKIDLVGASFGIYKIHGVDIDFCFPRKETLIGKGHKDFEVSIDPYISTEDAARRRDFTINSIMQNVNTGEFVDHFGGIGDLKRKVIKHIDDKTFIEDPLRVLRACQFAARLGFEIDEKTIQLCKNVNIDALPVERIYEELKKGLLKSKTPSILIQKLIQLGKFETIFPNIEIENQNLQNLYNILDDCAECKAASNHPEYFMFAALIYALKKTDSLLDVNNIIQSLSRNKEFCTSVQNLVSKKLELDELCQNGKSISDYSLKKLAIASIDKYNIFNIDDVLLLGQEKQIQNETVTVQISDRINHIRIK